MKDVAFTNEVFYLESKVLNEIISKCKSFRDQKRLDYVNKV